MPPLTSISRMSDQRQTQANLDNHADQCNPNNERYQGHKSGYPGTGDKPDRDNHANQLNPNHQEFGGGQNKKK